MISSIVTSWVNYMIKNGAPESERDIYAYGLTCTLNELFGDVISLILALMLNRVWEMLVWIIVFDLIRLNAGGYHASTPFRCLTCGTIISAVCVIIYPVFNGRLLLNVFCIIVSFLIVLIIAPVTNKNRPVSAAKIKRARKWALIWSVALSGLTLILHYYNNPASSVVLLGILSASLLSLAGYIKNTLTNGF